MSYLIDTCVISELNKRKPAPDVVHWFEEVGDENLFLSVVTVGELQKGISKLPLTDPRVPKLKVWLENVLQTFAGRVIPMDHKMALLWGRIVGEAERQGRPRPAMDAQIVATAIRLGMTLVTRNTKDMQDLGVPLLNPFEPM